ncbi:MAG: acyloxyacyl hydrolase [Betaproteobacteria bacterium]|nr:acyloxyacyl hydrolase [Betaproteobacteria bacterium]
MLFTGFAALPAQAQTAPRAFVEAEAGRGNGVNVFGIAGGLASGWNARTGPVAWGLNWQGHVQYWRAQHGGGQRDLTLVGGMPILRGGVGPFFVDVGIGADLLSRTQIGTRNLSTAFQFNELIGAGAAFGERHQYEVAARVQHVSNAGIKEPNPGVTFATLDLRYRF